LLPERTVLAIIRARIRKQRLKQYAFAAVWQCNRIYPLAVTASPAAFISVATARARQVVLRIGTEYLQLLMSIGFADNANHKTTVPGIDSPRAGLYDIGC
jgi:hypothetical protein